MGNRNFTRGRDCVKTVGKEDVHHAVEFQHVGHWAQILQLFGGLERFPKLRKYCITSVSNVLIQLIYTFHIAYVLYDFEAPMAAAERYYGCRRLPHDFGCGYPLRAPEIPLNTGQISTFGLFIF